ncbi:MAG TPA: zinc-dependent metalloprotease [Gemmatimonadales bacterium]|nr:zinc-dependent metalloprotease [Gemmatimonadales bacterium]
MPTRKTLSAALIVALAAFAAPGASAQRPGGPPNPQGGQAPAFQGGVGFRGQPQQPQGPRPYAEVITDKAVSDTGVFITHRIGDQLFYEIPKAMLGRVFLLKVAQQGTVPGVGYAGEEVTDRVVRWDRIQDKIFFRMVSYGVQADSNLPVYRAVSLSNQPAVLMTFNIAAYSPADSNIVIDVTNLYTTDVQELNQKQRFRSRRMDPARSIIEKVKTFPQNIDVSALQTFEVDSMPGAGGGFGGGRGVNTISMLLHYSMVLLPAEAMQPRLCDSRIGFFDVSFEDYGQDRPVVQRRCYISRWRLEKKDPSAAVSDPVKPIVFYIDPATPTKWVPWLIKGIEAWQPVFEAAGFSHAIMARPAPTPQEDPKFDVDDARYSFVRWLPSTTENAYGPHISDPRTGEILQSSVGWYQNITALQQAWYWVQAGAVDPRAKTLPFPDSLMGQMVAYVITHEIGHTLGLPHAHLSSGLYPTDSLRSKSYTCANGTSYSIMDYARNNYVAQPGDDVCMIPKLGPWDYYTINWGYRRWPGLTTPESERPALDSLARLQDTHPEYRFGDMDGIDPRAEREGLGDDPVKSTGYGLRNLKRLIPMMIPATTANGLEGYSELNDMYGRLIGQWALEMNQLAVVPGGVWRHEKYPDQQGVIHEAVPRDRQAAAVKFLVDNAFTTPTWMLDSDILRRIEPTGSVERIRVRQTALLTTLLQDSRLSRMAEQSAFATAAHPAYGIADLLGDLRKGLFTEASAARPVTDVYRRNIQRAFVDDMDRLVNTPLNASVPTRLPNFPGFTPPPPRPADARALARLTLQELDTQLRTAQVRTTDPVTKAHWADLRFKIDRALNPRGGATEPRPMAGGFPGMYDGMIDW